MKTLKEFLEKRARTRDLSKTNCATLPPVMLDTNEYWRWRLKQLELHHALFFTVNLYVSGTSIYDTLSRWLWCDKFEVEDRTDELTVDFFKKNFWSTETDHRGTTRLLGPFVGDVRVFSATIGHRGCMGGERTVVVNNVRLQGTRLVLADHMWLKWSPKWDAIEPVFGGAKVLIIGSVESYKRTNSTVDYTIRPTRLVKI